MTYRSKEKWMRNRVAVSGAIISLMITIASAQATDVWVQQARGRISGDTPVAEENKPKTAPEGGSTTAAAGSPTTPATCNQQNANSPACYSATQQTRGK
jgi:hypothetical protein